MQILSPGYTGYVRLELTSASSLSILSLQVWQGRTLSRRATGLASSGYAAACEKLRGHLGFLHPDLVIGYYVTSYGLMAALSWNGPLVVAPAGSDILRRRNFVRSQIVRFVLSKADLVLTWAEHMSRAVMDQGVQATGSW